jgi:hypothetical protein
MSAELVLPHQRFRRYPYLLSYWKPEKILDKDLRTPILSPHHILFIYSIFPLALVTLPQTRASPFASSAVRLSISQQKLPHQRLTRASGHAFCAGGISRLVRDLADWPGLSAASLVGGMLC